MKILRFGLIIFLSAIFSLSAMAQRGATANAEKAYNSGDYYDAITLYKKAFTKEKSKPKKAEIIFKVAECYRKVNEYKNQEVWYAKAIKANYKDALAILYLADALKFNGKYDEAIAKYNDFKKAAPSDERGDVGASACEQAQKWKDRPTRYRVENVASLNTKYSDFGIAYSNKDHRHVIYTSARNEAMGKNNDGGTGEKFQDLFEATVDKKGKWSSPKPLLEPVNSAANEGCAALDNKGMNMYFTRCDFEKGKIGMCEIYSTKRKGQTWDEPMPLPLAADSITIGQPSMSDDEETLYFVSDMPGGQGGKDIWKSTFRKKEKVWSKPENLGNRINTAEDEMFPYIAYDGTLYFSSKGHIGMGGLDIFRSKMSGSSWDEPVNLKYPVNSPADDFAYVIDESVGDKGFLSSNREGGKGNDDIYMWTLPPLVFTVSGKVYDTDNHANIDGAKVELFGSDGSNVPYVTDKSGTFKFDLKPETDYQIQASLPSYLSKKMELSTKGLELSKDFMGDFDFALKSILNAIELPNILYDLGKWDLRNESKKALDGLIETMNDNPTIVIELGSHTDSRPIPMSNDTLSQRRAESVVNYLIEKGIDPGRLVPRGYGQHEPRVLTKDIGNFHTGDQLTDEFISKLKSTSLKEEAHQLNRRTEFKVLRSNFIKGQKGDEGMNTPSAMPKDSTVAVPEVKKDTTLPTKAEVKEIVPSGPGEIYVTEKNDTYNSVAKKYSMTVKDLKTLNAIRSELIYEGMELKVTQGGDYAEFDKKFYTLMKGDDNWKTIAKKLDMKDSELKKMNKQLDEKGLRPGVKIRIAK